MDKRIAQLIQLMSQYDRGDIPRINHFLKVHNLAAVIGMMENIDKDQQLILEAVPYCMTLVSMSANKSTDAATDICKNAKVLPKPDAYWMHAEVSIKNRLNASAI